MFLGGEVLAALPLAAFSLPFNTAPAFAALPTTVTQSVPTVRIGRRYVQGSGGMSGSVINPPPVNVGGIHVGDMDSRGYDFSLDLKPPTVPTADPIPSASGVTATISRQDGVTTGDQDLQIVGPVTLQDASPTAGYVAVVTLQSPFNGAVAPYYVTFTATTTSGRVLKRDIALLVMPRRG